MNIKNNCIYIFFLLLLSQINISSQGKWERTESPTDKSLRSVHFVDSLYGWAVGFSGIIIHTSDGGINWIIQDGNTENDITDVFFLNRNLGWASTIELFSASGTRIIRTTNGGETWINSPHLEADLFINCILFLDSLNGWMGGKPYPIVKTTDGGNSWDQAEIDSSTFWNHQVESIKFYNSNFGYASGGKLDCCGVTWWTTNGGDHWYVIDTPFVAPEPIYKLHTYDSLNVLGVGGDFETTGFGVGMIRTSNGGATWEFEYIGMSGVAWDIDFRTDRNAWAALGGEGKLIYSLDCGLTWTSVPTPENAIIFNLIFTDSLHGFGVGKDGAIIKYKPQLVNNIATNQELISNKFSLQQNYPNPFNPYTKIKYSILEAGFIKLAVYNLLGEEVALIVDTQQEAGNYEFDFNSENLSNGIYLYTLISPDFKAVRKMIVLH